MDIFSLLIPQIGDDSGKYAPLRCFCEKESAAAAFKGFVEYADINRCAVRAGGQGEGAVPLKSADSGNMPKLHSYRRLRLMPCPQFLAANVMR